MSLPPSCCWPAASLSQPPNTWANPSRASLMGEWSGVSDLIPQSRKKKFKKRSHRSRAIHWSRLPWCRYSKFTNFFILIRTHTERSINCFYFWGKGRSSTEGRESKLAVHWINIWGSIYLLLWITKKLLFRGNSAKGEGERVWWWSAGHVMLLWMGPLNRAFVCLFYTTQDPEREEERERWSMDWLWGISLRFDFRIKSIHFFSTDRGVSTTSQSRTQSRETLLIHNTLTLFSFYIPEYQHMSSTPFAGSPARSQCRTPSRDR